MGYIGETNVRSGGGSFNKPTDAALEIIASQSAVVTVQKDGRTVKRITYSRDAVQVGSTSDYAYVLYIASKDFGTYVISSNSTETTKSISIAQNGSYKIVAPERSYLFKSGDGEVVPLTSDHETNSSVTITDDEITIDYTSTDYSQSLCQNTTAIDLSPWSTFAVTGVITDRTTSTDYGGFAFASSSALVAANAHSTLAKTAVLTGNTSQTTTVDISAISVSGFVGVVGGIRGTITEMYLER